MRGLQDPLRPTLPSMDCRDGSRRHGFACNCSACSNGRAGSGMPGFGLHSCPVIPRHGVHYRISIERRNIRIVGEALGRLRHHVRVGIYSVLAGHSLSHWRTGPPAHRIRACSLGLACARRLDDSAHRIEALLFTVGHDGWIIDIRRERQKLSQ